MGEGRATSALPAKEAVIKSALPANLWLAAHFPDLPVPCCRSLCVGSAGAIRKGSGVRVLRPERSQPRWDLADLDNLLPPDFLACVVWSLVTGLNLSEFYARIKSLPLRLEKPAIPCHCEERSDEAIPRLTSVPRLVRRGIASSLRSSQ
jgi:hypothetical protein